MRIVLLFIVFFSSIAFGQVSFDAAVFDSLLGKSEDDLVPGYTAVVIHKGHEVYRGHSGYANLNKKILIDDLTNFDVGSIGKQFTATCILLLEEQGKLNLDDDIKKYLPDFPKIRTTITINHLLGHASGIRSYLSLLELQNKLRSKFLTKEKFWEDLKKQEDLSYYPRDAFSYNNTGYVLLAEIVSKVSGQSFVDFAYQNIFKPLGMEQTMFFDKKLKKMPTSSFCYTWNNEKQKARKIYNPKETVGDGNLWTTVNDLVKWDQNFEKNILGQGKLEFFNSMEIPYRLNSGRSSFYGKGVNVKDHAGIKLIDHSGNWDSYFTQYSRFPLFDLSIIICSNSNKNDPRHMAAVLSSYIFKDIPKLGSSFNPVKSKVPLKNFEGHYLNIHTKSAVRKIVSTEEELYFIVPTPFGEIDYQLNNPVYFSKDKIEFTASQGGKIVFTMKDEYPIRYHWLDSPGEFRLLSGLDSKGGEDSLHLGKYENAELNLKIKVKSGLENNELKLKFGIFKSKRVIRLTDNFFWNPKENLVFEFTDNVLFLHADRASNIRFKKK
jgi:CubicO group peptidase (beta-lactamase class C family)